MFKRNRIPRLLALTAALVAIPATALAADQLGNSGYIDQIELHDDSADAYLQFHGRVFVAANKQAAAEYRWGGTSCGTRVLSDGQVSHLIHALDGGLRITPRFQEGQGGAKCLVGFTLG